MSKIYDFYQFGGRIPRKIKKKILDEKISKSRLKRMLVSVEIIKEARNMYERPVISPKQFCPHCGETGYYGTGNMSYYPEHCEKFHCMRCRALIGYIDNSAFIHALECKENNYNPEF